MSSPTGDLRKEFAAIFTANIKREGADKLLAWLDSSDFFTAPASTKYHGSYEGGLAQHSINVYHRLLHLNKLLDLQLGGETIAVVSLLHDLCKVNFYKQDTRNVKQNGEWVQVPYYTVEDSLCYGHGEGSVYIISSFIRLTREEALAINWHMGGFDDRVKGGSYALSGAWEKYPLGMLLHCADLVATYLDEKKEEEK